MCRALVALFKLWGRFHILFFLSFILKSELFSQSCQVLMLTGVGTWPPSFNYLFINFPFWWFPSQPKLSCPWTWSVDWAALKLRDLPASTSWVLGLKECMYHQTWSYFFFNFFSQVGSLTRWSLALRLQLPLFHLTSVFPIILVIFLNTRLSSIPFPGVSFLLELYIFCFSLPSLLLFTINLYKCEL